MKKRPTAVTDLSGDELSCIFIIVAQSGAAELARVIAVCRLFSQVGKSQVVLRALKFERFWGLSDSNYNYKKYQQINGLVSLAAEAGHSAAQYEFAKIILWSCRKFVWINLPLDKSENQTFLFQLSSKPSCNGKDMYQYRCVKMFLSQCDPSEFDAMYFHLRCYKAYCRKDSVKSQISLKHVWEMCVVLMGYEYDLVPLKWQGTYGPARALRSFEELRSKALRDLDDIFTE
ncbi:hypothetical protein QQ045_022508 [Rhodiola kirilowii]